jgi:hypothetical protein
VEAAGFVLTPESTMLANMAIRTDQCRPRSGRDRSLRLSVREALTGPGADFMSTQWKQAIEDTRQTLLTMIERSVRG